MSITVSYQNAALGHEIRGADLARGIGDKDFAQIERAFNDAGVVVIRDQRLTPDQQLAFSRRFGELESYPLGKFILPGYDEILVVSNIIEDGKPIGLADAGRAWHSDMSFVERPPRASLLYCLEVPRQHGKVLGDTLFANTAAAWDGLRDDIKRRIDGLKVRNSFSSYAVNKSDGREKEGNSVPDVMHPLVRTHPLTGRKCLYFSERVTARIGDLDRAATASLIAELIGHLTQPAYTYRHSWREGDLVIWDNCSSMHKAIFDYALPLRRRMHRTTVKGARPY